jgi:glycosyltransferase involved in cell wall biosynthesis
MAKKTVLFFVHGHPAVQPGGAEQYGYELYQALGRSDEFEPVLVARVGPRAGAAGDPHPGTRLCGVGGGPGQVLVYTGEEEWEPLNLSLRNKTLYFEEVGAVLDAYRPDVVHFQHTLWLGVGLVRFVRQFLPRAPVVYTLHEFMPICHHDGQLVRTRGRGPCLEASPQRCHDCFPEIPATAFHLRKRFVQSNLAGVDRFIAPSEFLLERYVDWGIPRERLVYEEYGRLIPAPPPAAPPADRPRTRFGYFGQVNPFKGLDVLVAAFARLPAPPGGDGPRLVVHGANLERQSAEVQDRFRGLLAAAGPAVTFAGPYPHDQVGALMRQVDWVVVPSIWWENSPLVIQEAFMAGRPVICSDIGGMREKVRDGVDGLHFRAGDPADLAATIRRACDTPGLWDRLRAGIRPVYGMDEHVARLTDLYRSLLTEPRG